MRRQCGAVRVEANNAVILAVRVGANTAVILAVRVEANNAVILSAAKDLCTEHNIAAGQASPENVRYAQSLPWA